VLFVTPGLHRRHHSALQLETDSNYGNVFSFWDRLFGTLWGEARASGAAFRFGLDDVNRARAGNFARQLELPFRN
jgi:sterol desaturase/sphingolipid hydroxylase (fatty acid hydroxylase superfamily)